MTEKVGALLDTGKHAGLPDAGLSLTQMRIYVLLES